MRATKKLAISAMVVALSAVLLMIGAFVSVADLLMGAIASLLVVFVFIEIRSPYTWLVWLATTLTVFFMPSGMAVGALYFLVFGLYPILKAYIERTPRPLWWIIKLIYVNAVIVILLIASGFILGVPFFESELWYVNAALWLLMNVAFVAYDMFITVMVRLYMIKYRKIFRKFLK